MENTIPLNSLRVLIRGAGSRRAAWPTVSCVPVFRW